jgi:hypothetical protein
MYDTDAMNRSAQVLANSLDKGKEQMADNYVAKLLGKGDLESIRAAAPMMGMASDKMRATGAAQLQDLVADRSFNQNQSNADRQFDFTKTEADVNHAYQDKSLLQADTHFNKSEQQASLFHADDVKSTQASQALQLKQMQLNAAAAAASNSVQQGQLNAQIESNKFQRSGAVMQAMQNGYEYSGGKFNYNPDVGAKYDSAGKVVTSSPYQHAMQMLQVKALTDARPILDPAKMLDARSKKNAFGGIFELDSTSLEPLSRVSAALGGSLIPTRDAEHWRQMRAADPDGATALLNKIGVPK